MEKNYDVIIVGGGLSGLAVANFLQKYQPEAKVLILEQAARTGGAIQSSNQEGFLAEWGAHGFLDNVEASRELLQDTGLDQEAQKAHLDKFVRYICLNGKLKLIPQNPKKIISSNLVSLPAKLRVLADLWKRPKREEQTVAQWAAYRFGRNLLPFVDAVLTGTYAGDLNRLSIDATFPGMRQLEIDNGSLIRGLMKKRKQAKEISQGKSKKRLPAMVSFPQGMGRLPEVLAENKDISLNTSVKSLARKGATWQVHTAAGEYEAVNVVLALSVNQSLALLSDVAGLDSTPPPVSSIPEAKIVTVVLGFTDSAKIPFGFGFLAPEQEKRFILGALFSTHMFPGRAPAGHVMLEALVGGRRHPEKLNLSDEDLISKSYEDLKQLINLPEPPCFTKVLRPAHGIPQLELGYPKLLAWRNQLAHENRGLHICGFGWEGIGINDMTKAAQQVAKAIAAGTAAQGESGVKGVYF
jgi:oxygen-dependent protoporphyrinogen oxidase